MNTTLRNYTAAREPLDTVIAAIPGDDWSRPSPCEGWSAREVLGHLIETQREFLAGRGLDVGEAPDVGVDPAAAWRTHADRVAGLLSDDTTVEEPYDGFFGPTTTGETLQQFYVWDMLVHRWDVATAAGLNAELSDAELDIIEPGASAFGDALYMEGICKPSVETGPQDDKLTRVLAKLGRRA